MLSFLLKNSKIKLLLSLIVSILLSSSVFVVNSAPAFASSDLMKAGPIEISLLPNDPGFTSDGDNIDRQWGLIKADFVDAWKFTQGQPSVIVAVIDTGIDETHEDFENTHFVPGYNIVSSRTIRVGSNSDDNGHGTLVSGVIAATANNNIGIVGAAPNVSIMPVKALDLSGEGAATNISEAIIWATDHKANVINLSLGGHGFSHNKPLADAITYAFDHNVVIIAAAGNDVAITGGNLDKGPVFPVCNDNGKNMVIGVTATDVNDLKPEFANYGKACVDVSAPGRRILSTINKDPATGTKSPNSYAYASGTSLSVPFVSAQAALLKSLYPSASNKQIRDRIIGTAVNIDELNLSQCAQGSCRGLLGGGRIDAAASLKQQFPSVTDGDVVQIANTNTFYYINGGKKQLISSFVKNQRFASQTPKVLSLKDLTDFPEGSYAEPLDGTLIKVADDPTIYYVEAGLRRAVTYQVFLQRGFNFNQVITLSNAEVFSWVLGSFLTPPDGTLVRSAKNPTVYWSVGGVLHPINYQFYVTRGLNVFPVVYMSDNDINAFPKGEAYML
jgi:hypothetical protein